MLFTELLQDVSHFIEQKSTIELVDISSYIFIIIIGAIGNIWAAWRCGIVLVFRQRSSVVTRGIVVCILIICVSDLIVLSALSLLVHNKINREWRFGVVLCKIYYAVEVLNKFVIPICLVQISRISYNSVNIARKGHRRGVLLLYASNAIAILTVGLLLAYVVVFSTQLSIPMRTLNGVEEPTLCVFAPPVIHGYIFNGLAFLVGYVLTSVAYVYFYASVPLMLKRRISAHMPACQQLNDANIDRIKYTVTSFVVVYLVCWTPYWILFWLVSMVQYLPRWMIMVSMFFHMLPYLSCSAYPVILTAMNRGIRSEHAWILSMQRKKLSTIREGAMQTLTAHVGMFHLWMQDNESARSSITRKTTSIGPSALASDIVEL